MEHKMTHDIKGERKREEKKFYNESGNSLAMYR